MYCNRPCLFVCLFFVCSFVCGSVATITRNCVHRSSPNWACRTVGEGSDHLQLIKFWPFRAPRKGSAAGRRCLTSALLQPCSARCLRRLWVFFSLGVTFRKSSLPVFLSLPLSCPFPFPIPTVDFCPSPLSVGARSVIPGKCILNTPISVWYSTVYFYINQETQLSLKNRATHLCKCNDVADLTRLRFAWKMIPRIRPFMVTQGH